MGLSASQTRYLSLTARKSNVEFQGQQINESRTALANQSSELYTEMMSLKAPTAPSPYTYVIDPAQCPSIDWEMADCWPLNETDTKAFEIYYAGNQPNFTSFGIPEYEKEVNEETGAVSFYKISYTKDGYRQRSTVAESEESLKGSNYCYKEVGYYSNEEKVSFLAVHTAEATGSTNGAIYKFNYEKGLFEEKDETVNKVNFPDNIKAYNYAASQYNTYSQPTRKCVYANKETAANSAELTDPKKNASGYKASATLNVNQAQYDAAMVQYEKDLQDYNAALEEINRKTEDIHEADKKLELQLKQLDTEQEAIQTEYDAIKKVIEKNIENTFKTFG